ncbi:glycosyltransferase family 4 protein [Vibrio sagamiensis]|uniref:Glycosyl transferase n=1 Tax=Vibrio sagamiensis NBRC 104589 TaxID=1219064 RepID=A0A511QFG7_9VIBR|nr:glycosyltransferase family 4 protein [Vibrio sagamiensis]PNQ69778.1 glycosyltransferase family 1 protein [Vibrio agarivorans]GEM76045.1 glycosyl transferase [Vibrio sagamiensis NBRC 104589]
MNICHVNLASGYHGGENQTLQLIKQQVRLGYQLTVVANPKSPFAEAVKTLDVKVILATHFTQSHAKSITQDCALVHVHEGRAIYWALIQHLLYGVPYIVTRRIDNTLKKKWLANLAYSKASAVVGLSAEIVQKVNDAYPDSTTYKIPSSPVIYPVNPQTVRAIKDRFAGKFVVIHGANMLGHKGFNVTIDAAKLLGNTNPSVHFCLLGDGPERQALESQAKGLTNVSFEGKQNNMGDWFAAADLQIHPSYTEGLGSVILEGMGAGLPVIGTNAGGIPDIIDHNSNGLLVTPGNPQQLADAIMHIAQDEELRQEFIAQGQEKLKLFDISYTANQYLDVYEKVLR